MWKILRARFDQGHRTLGFPDEDAVLPDRYRGAPALDPSRCREGCAACVEACPTGALRVDEHGPELDLGRCLFCAECTEQCSDGAIEFGHDYRMATRTRGDLLVRDRDVPLAQALDDRLRRIYGRSLRLRHVVLSTSPLNGGSVWESNPSTVCLERSTGFEVREAHRDPRRFRTR